MGGFGSGRQSSRRTTSDLRQLDVRRLARDGLLRPGSSFSWQWSRHGEVVASIGVTAEADRVWLDYRHRQPGDEWRPLRYPVHLERLPQPFGGERVWFRCPGAGCGRRVALLYMAGSGVFACRTCCRLAYQSQRETPGDRATRRADKIRDRLGWQAGILNGNGGKPKWMRWPTYARLVAQHDQSASQALAVWGEWIEVTEKRLKAMRR